MRLQTILATLGVLGLCTSLFLGYGRSTDPADRAQTTYFASGRVESRIEYSEGKRQGLAERWHASGTKLAEGRYEGGRMEGEWQFWNTDGTLDASRSGCYRAGEKVVDDTPRGL